MLNLSFAVNYALGGTGVGGYHLANLAIHVLAALAFFGLVRRTLLLKGGLTEERAFWTGWLIALLWVLHPLQTEAVTYVSQRAESLMGLFYLLTVYGFLRYASLTSSDGSGSGMRWGCLAVICCVLGMATKEVMVSAPLVVLLYDRTFVAGTFRDAWRRRRLLYLGLAATWLLLAYLVIGGGGNRSGAIGFGVNASWARYELTQFEAVASFQRAIALFPGNAAAYHNLGNALARSAGRRDDAIAAYQAALRISPDFPEAEKNLGDALLSPPANLPAAIAHYRAAVRLKPDFGDAVSHLGVALAMSPGGLDEAIDQLERAVRLAPRDASVCYDLGLARALRPGGRAAAIADFEQALRIDPGFALARQKLAELRSASP